MVVISMKQLLEAGIHFGHQTRRWNPKMKKYTLAKGNGIYIIDLQKVVKLVNVVYDRMKDIAREGDVVLFVGTKKQIQETIKDEIIRAGQYYVNHRWLGDTLTNWDTIQKRITRLKKINATEKDSTFEVLPKKEATGLNEEHERLEKLLGDITDMPKIPDVVYIVDPRKKRIAVQETRELNIPIIVMADTSCDPDETDAVTSSDDDTTYAVELITVKMADTSIEGNQGKGQVAEELLVEKTPEATPIEKIVGVIEGDNESAE